MRALRARWLPHLLVAALTTTAFLAAAPVPYRIDTDTGFQLRSVQQWARGESPNPATLRLPDPGDLGRDRLLWSNWWPAGLPFIYAPLVAAGLPLATAIRLTSLALFLLGSMGWLRLAERFAAPVWISLLVAVALAGYAITLGGAASLRTADLLAYAIAPWLIELAARSRARALWLFPAGLLLGAAYALRYTIFLLAICLLLSLALHVLRAAPGEWRAKGGRLLAMAAGFTLPVLAVFILNVRNSVDLRQAASGTRSEWTAADPAAARPMPLLLSLAGAPGLGLFQNDLWITHLVYFSDARLPLLRRLDKTQRVLLKSLLGIPGTIALAWALLRELRHRPTPALRRALWLIPAFYLCLLSVSLLVGYNYLANEARFAVGVMPLIYPAVLRGWLVGHRQRLGRLLGILLLAGFFGLPLAFATINFARNEIGDRRAGHYVASATGLFSPELSSGDVRQVLASIAAVSQPGGVIVLAGPSGWGAAFAMWLELPQRILPVSTFVAPLGSRFAAASDITSSTPLGSSRPLRVVLVMSNSLVEDGSALRMQSRFAQASGWRLAAVPGDSNVTVYFSDLVNR